MHGGVGAVKPQGFPLSRSLAHLGSHGLWAVVQVIGVELPPLWHQGHKGQPMPRTAAGGAITPGPRQRAPAPAAAPTGSAGGPSGGPVCSAPASGVGVGTVLRLTPRHEASFSFAIAVKCGLGRTSPMESMMRVCFLPPSCQTSSTTGPRDVARRGMHLVQRWNLVSHTSRLVQTNDGRQRGSDFPDQAFSGEVQCVPT